MFLLTHYFFWLAVLCLGLSQDLQDLATGKIEGPYWLHITSPTNTSVDGYAYRNSSSRTGFFTYWPTDTGHDIRLLETSHFMLHRPANSSQHSPADLISYAIPSPETPSPDDPVPNGAYLRFGYSPGTSLAWTYFSHYGENETWPVQRVAVHNSSGKLGLYRSSDVLVDFLGARDRSAEFLSNWYICWLFFQDGGSNITSGFFWSVASLDTWNYCTEIDITLEKVIK